MRGFLLGVASVAGCALGMPAGVRADGLPADSLLHASASPLVWSGTEPSGPGFDLLLDASRNAQFVLIAEEHNLREVNLLAAALFSRLHADAGFQHLVLETGSVIGAWMDRAAAEGGTEAVSDLVRRYPQAPTFATDEELALIAGVRSLSSAPGPALWGVDQELGALHILERLAELAPADARPAVLRLADEVRPYEITRTGDVHYLSERARPEDFEALVPLVGAPAGSEAAGLLDAVLESVHVYAKRHEPLGEFASGRTREYDMRRRFMERYREAMETEGAPPRALVKMGHWHLLRGMYRADVPTFGNFLCELAESHGLGSTVIATYVVNSPDAYRNTRGTLAQVADPEGTLVVDLRPLRPLVHAGRVDVGEPLRSLFFRADLLLLIGGGRTGSYSVAHGEPRSGG